MPLEEFDDVCRYTAPSEQLNLCDIKRFPLVISYSITSVFFIHNTHAHPILLYAVYHKECV